MNRPSDLRLPRLGCFHSGTAIEHAGATQLLVSPVDLKPYAELVETPSETVDQVVQAAEQAFRRHRKASVAQRAQWLQAAAAAVDKAAPEIIALLIRDIGKPRRAATFETQRSAQFLRACAAAVQQMGGETVPVDAAPAGAGRFGYTRRIPFGVVAGITPFNAPINLLVQKAAPALAAGNAIVVKPHPAGTRVALRVAQAFMEAGVPENLLNVATGDREAAAALARHPGVMAVSYTGGTAGGNALASAAGAKKFVAELGSNAANVVLADADLADAAKRIAGAAFEASGQQCISAQRIIVERPAYAAFLSHFIEAAKALKVGDPDDDSVDLGPMVSQAAADRVMGMVRDALERGGRWALEPRREDCLVSPGILVDAPRECSMWREEVFGPLALVEAADDVDHALQLANDSAYGLQGSVFTRSLKAAFRFSEDFEVGSLWVNEASRFRLDMYPFGGVKRSGVGREGVRYAIEEMSQIRFTGIRFDA